MKTQTDKNQNLGTASVASDSPNQSNETRAARFPRCQSKAEIKAERLSWALWAAGVYKREHNLATCGEFYERI